MEALLIGSFSKSPSSISFPVTAEVCSAVNLVQVLKGKGWNNPEKLFAPMISQKQFPMRHHTRSNNGRFVSFYCRQKNKFLAHAASEHPFESEPSKSPLKALQDGVDAFYRFSRPHTVIGTALSIMSVSLLAVEKPSDISLLFFTGVFEAILAALCMNIYIVGLNQLYDIEIDKHIGGELLS